MDSDSSVSSSSPKGGGSKQFLIIGVVSLLILVGAGAYLLLANKATSTPAPQTATNSPTPTVEDKNVFSSIQDALSKSLSLQCDYTGEDGTKTVAYLKAGAIRSDITGKTAQSSGSVIIKDNKMYYWNGKQGITMEFNVSEVMKGVSPSVSPKTSPSQAKQGESVMQDLEKYKQYCKPAVVADSLFVPPADVKFVDYSKMMPSGVSSQGGVTEEQIKALQKQYQTP